MLCAGKACHEKLLNDSNVRKEDTESSNKSCGTTTLYENRINLCVQLIQNVVDHWIQIQAISVNLL